MRTKNKNNRPPLLVLQSLYESMWEADRELAKRIDGDSVDAAKMVMAKCSDQMARVADQICLQVENGEYAPCQD